MAQATYSVRAFVLKKTKLGETDLILTLLAEDGQQLRVVAKGARKPSSHFAARLELYSQVDLLLACGRSLDIVKEVRLLDGNEALRCSFELSACAAPGAELLTRVSQVGLEHDRMFLLTDAAFSAMSQADVDHALAMSAALLLKVVSFAGFRPNFAQCANCGSRVVSDADRSSVRFSCEEGGSLCERCCGAGDAVLVSPVVLSWAELLLMSTFAQIGTMPIDRNAVFGVFRLCQQWIQKHIGSNLKSLDFLFRLGL